MWDGIDEPLPDGTARVYELRRQPDESWPAFLDAIVATFGIGLVHVHSIAQCRDGVIAALEALDVPYGYTVHDFSFACPTITFHAPDGMFCGGVTDEALCTRCLDAQPRFRGVDIAAWRARHRAFLARSAFLIAPSQWAASMLARYFPGRPIEVIAHGTARAPRESAAHDEPARPAYDIVDNGVPVVAVLGAIGPDKGSRRLERMVERVRSNGSRVRFVLIGYSDAENGPWQNADATFTIHGRYDPHQLPDLFARYRVKLVAFPSTGPESFSLTLSEAWAGGLPVIVPPIGALAERVRATDAGWIWTDAEWRSDEALLERIIELVDPASTDALAAAAARARAVVQPTVDEMTRRTLARYDACRVIVPTAAPFAPARMRDALGYTEWQPPVASGAALVNNDRRHGVSARLRHVARNLRRSVAGRAFARLAPASLRGAMKRRDS